MENPKNVLLAFNGGRNSSAAAFLLLKQGYKVTACSFLMGELESLCSLRQIDNSKEVCRVLGINHISFDLRSEFSEKVTSPFLNARLLGEDFNPCYYCNILKVTALLKKAEELSFDFVATGHVASVFKDPNGIKILRGRENDQSFFISGLRENLLEKLLLPLGKLTEEEIDKVTDSIGIKLEKKGQQTAICMGEMEKVTKLIEKEIPPSLRFDGLIIDEFTKVAYGNHPGIYNFRLGMKNLSVWDKNIPPEATVTGFILRANSVLVSNNPKFIQDSIHISLFYPFADIDLTIPINCYFTLIPNGEKISCLVFPGNNGNAFVKMKVELEGPIEKGRLIVFYEELDGNSRLIATGFVANTGVFIQEKKGQSFFVN